MPHNVLITAPPLPNEITLDFLKRMRQEMDAACGIPFEAPPTYLVNRTAHAILQQRFAAEPAIQRHAFSTLAEINALATILLDPYLPCEQKQFRFPRSKKRRIRRKWAKNLRNFREVPIIFKLAPGAFDWIPR